MVRNINWWVSVHFEGPYQIFFNWFWIDWSDSFISFWGWLIFYFGRSCWSRPNYKHRLILLNIRQFQVLFFTRGVNIHMKFTANRILSLSNWMGGRKNMLKPFFSKLSNSSIYRNAYSGDMNKKGANLMWWRHFYD
jgi:hypothetical protein